MAHELMVPSFCPVCQMVMKGSRSVASYYNFGCCTHCHIQWVEGREERWSSGWRPSPQDVERFLDRFNK